MPKVIITRDCRACGDPATAGQYCHPCSDHVREMVDDHNRVSAALFERPTEGVAYAA